MTLELLPLTYGQILKSAREARGMSRERLALYLGVGITVLAAIERDERHPFDPRDAAHARAIQALQLDAPTLELAAVRQLKTISLAGLDPGQIERVVQLVAQLRAGAPEAQRVARGVEDGPVEDWRGHRPGLPTNGSAIVRCSLCRAPVGWKGELMTGDCIGKP